MEEEKLEPAVEVTKEEEIKEKPKKKDKKKRDKKEVSPLKEAIDITKSPVKEKLESDEKAKKAKKKKREPEPELLGASPEKEKKKKRKKDKKEAKNDEIHQDPYEQEEVEYKRSIKMEEIDSQIKPKIKKALNDKIETKMKENSPKKKSKKHKKQSKDIDKDEEPESGKSVAPSLQQPQNVESDEGEIEASKKPGKVISRKDPEDFKLKQAKKNVGAKILAIIKQPSLEDLGEEDDDFDMEDLDDE